jgi:hypothetical protein
LVKSHHLFRSSHYSLPEFLDYLCNYYFACWVINAEVTISLNVMFSMSTIRQNIYKLTQLEKVKYSKPFCLYYCWVCSSLEALTTYLKRMWIKSRLWRLWMLWV